MSYMDYMLDRNKASDLLDQFAEFLEQGLPYGAAFLAAAWRSGIDPGATLAFMAEKFAAELVPCSALLEPLIDADLVDTVRRGEKEADIIGNMRIAAGLARSEISTSDFV